MKADRNTYSCRILVAAIAGVLTLALFSLVACSPGISGYLANDAASALAASKQAVSSSAAAQFALDDLPAYSGKPSVDVNGGAPFFGEDDLKLEPFATYSTLDKLGRCGVAYALVGPETMPAGERGSIGAIKPSGWRISKYDWIDGKYLFNRCHLIAYSLAGENDNPRNLITGTRSMNTQGMLPYEQRVASYVESTGNHVLYRVTPVFEGDNPIASGVLMEAESVEDAGKGISFCVWCYNVEPGVVIDYETGDNREGNPVTGVVAPMARAMGADASAQGESIEVGDEAGADDSQAVTYILNTRSHKFHYPDCPSVAAMKDKNKAEFGGTRDEAIANGFTPCGNCNP